MRYISEKKENKYLVTGIKEMETIDGEKVEIKVDSKEYDKAKLEEIIEAYKKERDSMYEQYTNSLEDLSNILEAINNSN